MSIAVQCAECEHEWNEGASKAGRSVECPECQAKNRVPRDRSPSSRRRPQAKQSNLARTMLIGSTIFLVGVVAMLGFRMSQIDDEDDGQTIPTANTGDSGQGTAIPNDPDAISIPAPGSDGGSTTSGDSTESGVIAPVASTKTVNQGTADAISTSDDSMIASAINTDRGRELMAAMNNVGLKVTGFSADVREAVADVTRTAITGALEQCKLSVRAPDVEPLLLVELQLRNEKLLVSARLIAKDQQKPVRVWERSGTVAELTEKALSTGLLPTSLDRDVAMFFKSLRLEFNDARRQFGS